MNFVSSNALLLYLTNFTLREVLDGYPFNCKESNIYNKKKVRSEDDIICLPTLNVSD